MEARHMYLSHIPLCVRCVCQWITRLHLLTLVSPAAAFGVEALRLPSSPLQRREAAAVGASYCCRHCALTGAHGARALARMSVDDTELPGSDQPLEPGSIGGLSGDWRVERARLVEQHAASVRRRKPRFLPFAQGSSFAQTLGLTSKEDWYEWLELGEGQTPYVPRDPESYYVARGEWLGWHTWLTGSPM